MPLLVDELDADLAGAGDDDWVVGGLAGRLIADGLLSGC